MNYSLGESGVEIDLGHNAPGAIVQRKESDVWYDYVINGALVVNPFDVEKLPPGFYRLVEPPASSHPGSDQHIPLIIKNIERSRSSKNGLKGSF